MFLVTTRSPAKVLEAELSKTAKTSAEDASAFSAFVEN